MNQPKTVVSGVRVTGPLHIGNYFGAIKKWIELQKTYTCYFGVMDWHAMTSKYRDSAHMNEWTHDIIAELIAWGIDPVQHTLFVQSLVPQHLELLMIFSNITPLGWLERVTTWKDAIEEAKQSDTHNLGRFSYPVLQASDIAIYRGNLVPVGQDQVAHLELTREIIRRFNHIYGGGLPEPQPLLTPTPFIIGTDGRKMSKSYKNDFPMSAEKIVIEKSVKKMMTDPQRARREDPGDPHKCPVFSYHQLFSKESEIEWAKKGCMTAGIGCGDCKAQLALNIHQLQQGPLERKKELLNNPKRVDSIINEGSQKARVVAEKSLKEVRTYMKFLTGQK